MASGKQNQCAAIFGDFNYMECYNEDKMIVNTLKIPKTFNFELENNFLLYCTSKRPLSSTIIEEQQKYETSKNAKALEAIHVI